MDAVIFNKNLRFTPSPGCVKFEDSPTCRGFARQAPKRSWEDFFWDRAGAVASMASVTSMNYRICVAACESISVQFL